MKEASPSLTPARSKRRHPRVDCVGRVFASIGGGEEGSVVNLSQSGLLLRLTRALNPGSSYFVKLYLDGGEVAVVEAHVVRLVSGNEECLVGMEFLQVSARDRLTLQRFLGPAASQ